MITGARFDGHWKRLVDYDSQADSAWGFHPVSIWYIRKHRGLWLSITGRPRLPAVIVTIQC